MMCREQMCMCLVQAPTGAVCLPALFAFVYLRYLFTNCSHIDEAQATNSEDDKQLIQCYCFSFSALINNFKTTHVYTVKWQFGGPVFFTFPVLYLRVDA